VGSNPTVVVFCHCRFVCLQGLHVCLAPMPNIAFLYQEKAMLLCLQHASQTPASHSQRHAGDANGTWRSGQGRMDFHLSRLTVNVQVIFLVPSCWAIRAPRWVFCRLGLHFVVCTTCALARSGIVKKRVAGWVRVSGTPEQKPRNAAGLRNSKSNPCPTPLMTSGGFESGLLLQMLIDSSPTSQSCFSCTRSYQICVALVNILSRWVGRAAACVVQGLSDVRSASVLAKGLARI
jgi:hypothetical protein